MEKKFFHSVFIRVIYMNWILWFRVFYSYFMVLIFYVFEVKYGLSIKYIIFATVGGLTYSHDIRQFMIYNWTLNEKK